MSVVADPVPSTFDVPLTAEPADDPVLAVLRHARDRIRRGHTTADYVVGNGAVCALGACFRDDVSAKRLRDACYPSDDFTLAETTCEAISLLDTVAAELYPRSMRKYNRSNFLGARIEDVNQYRGGSGPDQRKQRVLHCYSVAIERQKALA